MDSMPKRGIKNHYFPNLGRNLKVILSIDSKIQIARRLLASQVSHGRQSGQILMVMQTGALARPGEVKPKGRKRMM